VTTEADQEGTLDTVRTITRQMACPGGVQWSAFYLGFLPEETVQILAEHLDQCADCSARLLDLEGQKDELVQELGRPPEEDPYAKESDCREALTRLRDLCREVPAHQADGEILPVPRQVGPYRLLRKVGAGSMGTVYQARHERLNSLVALKIMSNRRVNDPHAVARFRREIEVIGRLDHSNIIRSIDAGEADDVLYLAMEFVEGIDLARLVQVLGPLHFADACELVHQAALGLHHAHLHGLVHRDVKPSNILLGRDGQVKVLDLGLALPSADAVVEYALTSSGQILGTFDYMAPEQCRNAHAVDARTDIYSLGCSLYHLLAGHVPFAGSRYQAPQHKLWAIAYETPPSLGIVRADLSPELDVLIGRMLAKDPTARFASAKEVAEALVPFAAGSDLRGLFAGLELIPEPAAEHGQPKSVLTTIRPRIGEAFVLMRVLLPVVASLLLVGIVLSAVHRFTSSVSLVPRSDEPSGVGKVPEVVAKSGPEQPVPPAAPIPQVYPAALFVFEERGAGAKEMGQKVTDLLFAKLSNEGTLALVDREDLGKTLAEAELNLSGAVKPAEISRVGQLTGAKILVTGSIIHLDKKMYLVAKIIGTETSRVAGVSVEGKATDDLDGLVTQLADKVADAIARRADELVAKVVGKDDRLAALKKQLEKSRRPKVLLELTQRRVGSAAIDPTAQTELTLFCKETGFEVIDATEGGRSQADVILTGEGVTEFASRHGNLVTVKARLEIKAVDRRTGRVLVVDRQTTVVVDLTERLAGKAALQEAAATIAGRLLPRLAEEPKKEKMP
jgi:serine/threonine protein kinase